MSFEITPTASATVGRTRGWLRTLCLILAATHMEDLLGQNENLTLFLSGDVMTGRGIDQIMPTSVDPQLYETYVRDAGAYVELAEQANGPIPESVRPSYIWGEALEVLREVSPDVRAINLETSVTTSDEFWIGKGIHYRMHPENVEALRVAGIDMCSLANNHVLDWGYDGLEETISALESAGIEAVGAGKTLPRAAEPAVMDIKGHSGSLFFFACGFRSSGIPAKWAAASSKAGVYLIEEPNDEGLDALLKRIGDHAGPDDIIVVSIHWGGNWGYRIPSEHKRFARALIDAGVDVIHGHSSHHVMGIEVYRERPILYGCGDLINDYEGIGGHESYRGDLSLMFFPTLDPKSGKLVQLRMTPMQIRQFQLHRASGEDAQWLAQTLDREGRPLGTSVELQPDNTLTLRW